ncbi:MAG: hypothetical protein O7E54_01425 [Planctomycetota bacterium]|nr:hypothetical protein [Planctomycetota bacterium]
MKRFLCAFLAFSAIVWAQDESKNEPESDIDGVKLLNQIVQANEARDITELAGLMEDVVTFAKAATAPAQVDPIAAELRKSLKAAKGNHGTQRKIITALGELRSKNGTKILKRIAFQKKARDENAEELQAIAILAISVQRDPKMIAKLADQMKSRSLVIAKAGMACFKNYGPSKGKTRRNIAELLMKRMEAERPAKGQGGKVSGEAQKRWQALAPVIVESMQSICRESTITDVENWRQWWKEIGKNRKSSPWRDEPKE